MGKLITASILDSYDWLMHCPSHLRDKAFKQIVDQLNRTPYDLDPAIKRGMQFESLVCANLDTESKEEFIGKFAEKTTPKIGIFWDKCRGGRQQAKVSKTVTIDGIDYYFYGKRDIAFYNKTIDIKTTGDFKGPKYYLDKNQHAIYIYCTEIEPFDYLIAEFDDVIGTAVDVMVVDATMPYATAEERCISKVKEFINFLGTDDELLKAYNTRFCRQGW